MLRTQTHLWRVSLLTSLGLLASACGGDTAEEAVTERDQGNSGSGGSTGVIAGGDGGASGATIGGAGGRSMVVGVPPEELVTGCDNPTSRLVGNVTSGLIHCSSGVVHRPVPVQCPNTLSGRTNQVPGLGCEPVLVANTNPDAGATLDAGVDMIASDNPDFCSSVDTYSECNNDADCTAQPFGHCEHSDGQLSFYVCKYGCESDSDCSANQACVCGENIGECIPASCRQSSDCDDGLLCSVWAGENVCGSLQKRLACQTPNDECRTHLDCSGGTFGSFCVAPEDSRTCVAASGVVCGRPFLVDGQFRLAQAIEGSDFVCDVSALAPSMAELTGAQRDELARAWTEIGLMEHASVAAFARFALQLLQLGAPSQMLRDTQQAMADETEHTHLAFTLASHYAGRNWGPGPLPVEGALAESDLASVMQLVIREGCLGETVAALEAAEALSHCQDPAVREVLQTISRDELRHSELAWRFVAWALSEQPRLAPLAASTFAEMEKPRRSASSQASRSNSDSIATANTLRHGIVGPELRSEIRQAACREIVGPCARALLASLVSPVETPSVAAHISKAIPSRH